MPVSVKFPAGKSNCETNREKPTNNNNIRQYSISVISQARIPRQGGRDLFCRLASAARVPPAVHRPLD